ncbi:protein of unknown function [Candidatus Promineifilum breve]|uniref:Uncharacterized protein n=1 Tax=Candidatus Promineifilum breve TaxID=1806508 RepID=A0A160T8W3_9CHLR|nr:protein of unknown function [Candidatus Promineifilum breve]
MGSGQWAVGSGQWAVGSGSQSLSLSLSQSFFGRSVGRDDCRLTTVHFLAVNVYAPHNRYQLIGRVFA